MKNLLLLSLLLISIGVKAQYHLRVVQNDFHGFRIEYTNNNFKTIEKIRAFSGTSFNQYDFDVKQDALDFGHKMINYQKCTQYVNDQKKLYHEWLSHNKDYFSKSVQVY